MDVTKKPEIYCALNAYFPDDTAEQIWEKCSLMGFKHLRWGRGRYVAGRQSICFNEIYYREYLEIGDALQDLFAMIPIHFNDFCQLILSNNGKVVIDIAFVSYGAFPVLSLEGEVMHKIRMLCADIDIDPYC